MDSVRVVLNVLSISLKKLLTNVRFYIAVLLFILLNGFALSSYGAAAASMGLKITPWIFPLLTDDSFSKLFIIFGAALIYCDAPFIDESTVFVFARAGRKRLFWGNILFIAAASLFYSIALPLITNIVLLPHLELSLEWGSGIRALIQTGAANAFGVTQLSYNYIVLFTPVSAMLFTLFAVWLNSMVIGLINYTFNLWFKRKLGPVLSGVYALTVFLPIKLALYWIGYYISPPTWIDITVYNWNGYSTFPDPLYIYGILGGMIVIGVIASYIGNQKKDYDFVTEN